MIWRSIGLVVLAAAMAFGVGFGAGWLDAGHEPGGPSGTAVRADPIIGTPTPDYYVEAGQFVVPVLSGGRTLAFVLAQVTVEAADGATADRLRRQLPHARNALLQALYGMAGSGAFDGDTTDVAAVGRALRDRLNEDLGAGTARTVLFDRLLRQPNSRA